MLVGIGIPRSDLCYTSVLRPCRPVEWLGCWGLKGEWRESPLSSNLAEISGWYINRDEDDGMLTCLISGTVKVYRLDAAHLAGWHHL